MRAAGGHRHSARRPFPSTWSLSKGSKGGGGNSLRKEVQRRWKSTTGRYDVDFMSRGGGRKTFRGRFFGEVGMIIVQVSSNPVVVREGEGAKNEKLARRWPAGANRKAEENAPEKRTQLSPNEEVFEAFMWSKNVRDDSFDRLRGPERRKQQDPDYGDY